MLKTFNSHPKGTESLLQTQIFWSLYRCNLAYLWNFKKTFKLGLFDLTNKIHSLKYLRSTTIENRIYREEFTKKRCKTSILLYCFHTAGVLHIFMLYNLLGPGISFYRKSKIIVKRKPNYEICWFHNWPMIISHRHFTNDDFPL